MFESKLMSKNKKEICANALLWILKRKGTYNPYILGSNRRETQDLSILVKQQNRYEVNLFSTARDVLQ